MDWRHGWARASEVASADEFHVCVRWPWRWLHDAQSHRDEASGSDNSQWRGQLCFDRDKDHPDAGWLFQFDPGLPVLQAGDRCRVGIPPTIVHVLDVFSWCVPFQWSEEPPASLAVYVLPRGAAGTAAGPTWPLTLLAGIDGDAPRPERAARVARSTVDGDHASHLSAWSRLAATTPLGMEHQSTPGPDGHEPLRDRDRVASDTRVELVGKTFTQILGALVHSCGRRRMVGAHADELEVIALQRRLQVRAAEMANVLRELRSHDRSIFSG